MSDARDLRAAAAGELARRFPVPWLDEHAVLPLEATPDGGARVAADGPLPDQVRDTLARRLGSPLTIVATEAGAIRAALLAAPRLAPTGVNDRAGESAEELRALASREPVVQVVEALFAEAVRAGASDIHLESEADALRIRLRLDGVLQETQRLGPEFRSAVISRLKVLAGLDIAERRLPQDGRAQVVVDQRALDVRVATLPALHGESVVLRLLDTGHHGPNRLETLGFDPVLLPAWRQALHAGSGLLLVSGPTGSGKTTTLYAALRERSTPGVKVVTVEDPVEVRLAGAVQLPVNLRTGFTFAQALRAMLRHDPDVLLVGEMRDAETAEIAVRAALTGHLVLSTVHTTDAVGALVRLRDMGLAPYLLAATLRAVLAQRLVRRVCAACAVERVPDAAEIAALQEAGVTVSRMREGHGCPACRGTGFHGRLAVGELLTVTDALTDAFCAGAPLGTLRAVAQAAGVRPLRHAGMDRVATGETTVAEVLRVTGSDPLG